MKRCTKCGKEKPDTEFTKRRSGHKKLRSHCKQCIREENQTYNAAHREEKREKTAAYYLAHREEKLKKDAAYSKAHPEKARARTRTYYAKHRDKCREYASIYYAAHKPEYCAYVKMRYRTDPNRRVYANLLAGMNKAIKNGKGSAHLVDLIGCTIPELRAHLEKQFLPGMSWENYTRYGWHIDHIIPCNCYDLTDPKQQRACYNFTNLQPLWSVDNWKKSANIKGYKRERKPRTHSLPRGEGTDCPSES
jgi:hypothetical protein